VSAQWITPQPVSSFVVHHRDEEVVLVLRGEIDVANRDEFERSLDLAAFSLPAALIIDLGELDFIDGGGAIVLVAAAHTLEAFGTAVALRAPRPPVRRVLELIGGPDLPIE